MELHVSTNAGLIEDPVGYLLEQDGGSNWLSVVRIHFFRKISKAPGERFGDYFRRLVARVRPADSPIAGETSVLVDKYPKADKITNSPVDTSFLVLYSSSHGESNKP